MHSQVTMIFVKRKYEDEEKSLLGLNRKKIKVKYFYNDYDTECLVLDCRKFRIFHGDIGFCYAVCNMEIHSRYGNHA